MSKSKRPDFSMNLSVQDFEKYYWYKHELMDISRTHSISTSGTKLELEERIKKLLNGEKITDPRKSNTTARKKQQLSEISLHTRLIPEGFKFNRQAREFFAKYYNKPKFSFTKEMAAALREAERNGNTEMTVADLIEAYEGRKKIESSEEKTYQWNNFVRDFNNDPNSKNIKHNKMRVAAQLWKQVLEIPGYKQYVPKLLEDYLNQQDRNKST